MHIHLPFGLWQFTLLTVWNLSAGRGFNEYEFDEGVVSRIEHMGVFLVNMITDQAASKPR
jgi:hypothetical protein